MSNRMYTLTRPNMINRRTGTDLLKKSLLLVLGVLIICTFLPAVSVLAANSWS